jgi:ABC-type Mn2+/Zn2+ transport system permease subunit
MMLLAAAFSTFFNLAGLELSYRLNWPPGATIALLAASLYLLALAFNGKYFLYKRFPKIKD